ncbi:unnamed protein product [Schistocephalus solidus]|uniref:Ubiquitin-like domain-containing protein n=1 Tax=Schistocephalus solidus TaxID=70667 RepID=A0A183SZF0_SCHSO|nr:unnamed protein product [Schistocephalus solidus]
MDGCVVYIEPVLVLTVCAAGDIHGGGLDHVPQLKLAVLNGGVLFSDWETRPHLRDDEVMVRPSVSTGDRLCHQHVLLVTPPDEDIIHQVPVSRPGLQPGHPLPHREAEEGIGQDQVVFCAVKLLSEPVSCLMWEWAHWLTDRRTRLRAPQHDLAPITHTPGFTNSGDMEQPSPSDSQSTGQPLDTHSTYTEPTAWSGNVYDRLLVMRLSLHGNECLTIVNVYGLPDEVNKFLEDLHILLPAMPKEDMLIFLGNLRARDSTDSADMTSPAGLHAPQPSPVYHVPSSYPVEDYVDAPSFGYA